MCPAWSATLWRRVPCPHALDTHLQDPAVVHGSRPRLLRLLSNLVVNAERHARTRIEVSVTTENDHAALQVIDDGPGIPAADANWSSAASTAAPTPAAPIPRAPASARRSPARSPTPTTAPCG
ncbi:hypothetical protein ETD83_04125 [Actinomadura soli]|uniref:histidine kinase n=1 Tax=Actinomadura soli TaxID=2508997 RepID=A0A5C4JKZ6_9ACTN|nr:hypothetical protein ETD83_04125 [Actinomadura soli]